MNPMLDIVVLVVALIAGGVVFDWRVRRGTVKATTSARRNEPPARPPSPAAWK